MVTGKIMGCHACDMTLLCSYKNSRSRGGSRESIVSERGYPGTDTIGHHAAYIIKVRHVIDNKNHNCTASSTELPDFGA
jgi:hypothetical protein